MRLFVHDHLRLVLSSYHIEYDCSDLASSSFGGPQCSTISWLVSRQGLPWQSGGVRVDRFMFHRHHPPRKSKFVSDPARLFAACVNGHGTLQIIRARPHNTPAPTPSCINAFTPQSHAGQKKSGNYEPPPPCRHKRRRRGESN